MLKTGDCTVSSSPTTNTVVNRGWLLHKVKWSQDGVYRDVTKQYENYLMALTVGQVQKTVNM